MLKYLARCKYIQRIERAHILKSLIQMILFQLTLTTLILNYYSKAARPLPQHFSLHLTNVVVVIALHIIVQPKINNTLNCLLYLG